MGEENLEQGRTAAAGSLEDLLGQEAAARTPDFDLGDEDVFDLELDPEIVAGLFACEPEEYADLLAERVAEDKAAVTWRNEPRFVKESGLYRAIPTTFPLVPPSRTWLEAALVGLLLVNALLIGLFLVIPEVFDGFSRVGSTPPSGYPRGLRRDAAPAPKIGPASSRAVTEQSRPSDVNAMPDQGRYESAQHWIGRGQYEKAATILNEYLAAHPGLNLLQCQALFSSLMYCAQQLGDNRAAASYFARVESFRHLAASPEDLWEEASAARVRSRGAEMRPLYARMLLQSARLEKRWSGTGRIDAARTAFGDAYRFAARDTDPARDQQPNSRSVVR